MIIKIALLATFGLFAFTSCVEKEDKSAREFPQELLIDSERYELAELIVFNYGPNPNLYQGASFNLSLISEGIKVHTDSATVPDSLSGTGYVLHLETYSPDSLSIREGEYLLDTSKALYTISQADLITYNLSNSISQSLKSGSLEVIRLGEVYTLVGAFKGQEGEEVEFSFQSELNVFRRF